MTSPDSVLLPRQQMEEVVAWLQQVVSTGGTLLTLLQGHKGGVGETAPKLEVPEKDIFISNNSRENIIVNEETESHEDYGVKLPKGIKVYVTDTPEKSSKENINDGTLKKRSNQFQSNTSLQCSHCEFKTNYNQVLVRHKRKMHDMVLKCTECDYKTYSRKVLGKHRYNKHGIDKHNTIMKSDEINIEKECNKCQFKGNMYNYSIWKNHNLYEHGTRDYLCDQCEKTFFTQSNLTSHIESIHVGAIFDCVICGFKTSTKLNLKRHVGKHHTDKNILCAHCPYKASVALKMTNHTRKEHMDKAEWPKCTECEYSSWKTRLVKQHYMTVHMKARIQCEICSNTFTQLGNMQAHMQKVHKDMIVINNVEKTRALFSERYSINT